MKQPNLGYADVKLDFTCMHPAGCARRVSLCDYYDLCGTTIGYPNLMPPMLQSDTESQTHSSTTWSFRTHTWPNRAA